MRIFVNALYPEDTILCPFMGIEWDETYEGLKSILKDVAVVDHKITPFIIRVIGTKRELIYSHKVSHPNAEKDHKFFLFDDKKLIKSANHLSGIFDRQLA